MTIFKNFTKYFIIQQILLLIVIFNFTSDLNADDTDPSAEISNTDSISTLTSALTSPSGNGGTITPQLNTGAAVYSIPVALPPARGAMQPAVSINYNSQRGNGWAGVGWDMEYSYMSLFYLYPVYQ